MYALKFFIIPLRDRAGLHLQRLLIEAEIYELSRPGKVEVERRLLFAAKSGRKADRQKLCGAHGYKPGG